MFSAGTTCEFSVRRFISTYKFVIRAEQRPSESFHHPDIRSCPQRRRHEPRAVGVERHAQPWSDGRREFELGRQRPNDTHGHEAGSRLLRQIANAVQSELRASDVPARYGGDEFIVLLPETPPKGAMDVAERIRRAISGAALALEGKSVASSVSVGVACFPADGIDGRSLLHVADQRMYEDKFCRKHGRGPCLDGVAAQLSKLVSTGR